MCSASDLLNGRMVRVRSLLVALLLACPGVVLAQGPAHACKCTDLSVRDSVKRADAVFSGVLVDSSTARDDRKRPRTTYRIDAETLYKGDLPGSRVLVMSTGGSCSLGDLPSDRRFVFFVSERGADLSTNQCSGTGRAKGALLEKVEKVAGPGTDVRPSPPSQPAEPEFTPVDDGEPEELTRLAAPGLALTLVGLLGLLVVRRRDDRV